MKIWCQKRFTILFNGKAYTSKLHLEVSHICFLFNILSANFNFLCDLKILLKAVPIGSNLMRSKLKHCGMYGKHRYTRDKEKR